MKMLPPSSLRDGDPVAQLDELVAVAGEHDAIPAAALDQRAQLLGHLEHEILLVVAVDGDGARVDAAVAGIEHDHRQLRAAWVRDRARSTGCGTARCGASGIAGFGARDGSCLRPRGADCRDLGSATDVDHQPIGRGCPVDGGSRMAPTMRTGRAISTIEARLPGISAAETGAPAASPRGRSCGIGRHAATAPASRSTESVWLGSVRAWTRR